MEGPSRRKQFQKRPKTIDNQFRAGNGFNALMAGNGEKNGIVLPLGFGGHLHTPITLCVPYALRMQPYAVRMHFFGSSRKLGGSRDESACEEPYALYAPLLGVGVFSAFFLLREVHTVHTAAYGSHRNPALALLPVGIGVSSARENRKCIRRCIRLSGQKAPIGPLPHRPPRPTHGMGHGRHHQADRRTGGGT